MSLTFSMALLYSLLGISIVFFALVLLMGIIKLMTLIGDALEARRPIPAPVAVEPVAEQKATGSRFGGEVMLFDTDPRDAAMCMAIVADTSGIPLNELRFISIREIKE